MLVRVMFVVRQRADKVPLSHVKLLVMMAIAGSLLVLFEPVHGQPNYYFKASGIDAPAVKSLPRIGRRSDDAPLINDDDSSSSPFTLWQTAGGNGGGAPLDPFMGGSSGGGSSSRQYLLAPFASQSSQMGKALLWRKLFGNAGGSNFDDVMLDGLYQSKS